MIQYMVYVCPPLTDAYDCQLSLTISGEILKRILLNCQTRRYVILEYSVKWSERERERERDR